MALGEVRRGLSAGLRNRRRGPQADRAVSGFLQYQAAALEPWCADTRPSLLRRDTKVGGSGMNFAVAVGSPLRSGYALPARRPNSNTLRNQPAGNPLNEGGTL